MRCANLNFNPSNNVLGTSLLRRNCCHLQRPSNPQINTLKVRKLSQVFTPRLSGVGSTSPTNVSLSITECTAGTGLRLWKISGDGSCLFRALAQGRHQLDYDGTSLTMMQEKTAAAELRKQICSEMRRRKHDLAPFLEEDFDSYLASMSKIATWGGEPELSVAPHCLNRSVQVYMYGAMGLEVMSTYTNHKFQDLTPVKVLFNGIGHYDLLMDRQAISKL